MKAAQIQTLATILVGQGEALAASDLRNAYRAFQSASGRENFRLAGLRLDEKIEAARIRAASKSPKYGPL